MKLRQKIEKFMYGRYGNDKFGMFLLYVSLILMIINAFFANLVLYFLYLFIFGYCVFRILSRNINKRYMENQKFEKISRKVISYFKLKRSIWRDRKTHVYTKCPRCRINIRLPKKAGKHQVKCPKCNTVFDFKCRK